MADFYAALADACTQIIQDPASNISKLSDVFRMREDRSTVFLSLMKVFKHIVPLYRIRVHSDKVKHRNGELAVSPFDRELLRHYNEYVKELCSSDSSDSFRCAAELLRSLDHFNFADRIVAKVLLGTRQNSALGMLCVDALVDRIKNDTAGDTIFMIVNQCLDYKHSHLVVEALLESEYLQRCVETRIDKEEKYNRQRAEQKKREKKVKRQKGFFEKAPIYSKAERKEEKRRLALQAAARKDEGASTTPLDDKNYVRTVNALQRLYFTVFKEGIRPCYKSTFIGVRKYIKLIRLEFREGLYVLLNDAIRDADPRSKLEGVLTVLSVYSQSGLDFKRIIDTVYVLLHPLGSELELSDYEQVKLVVRQLFVDIRQPPARAAVLLQRLMQARVFRYVGQYAEMIKMLETTYDIDFSDGEIKTRSMYDPGTEDIDKIWAKPFYEYFLFKRVL